MNYGRSTILEIYDVKIEAPAYEDLDGIFDYIANHLKEPTVAEHICDSIEAGICSLDQIPGRYAIVSEEPFASQGIRRMLIKNYTAFYIVDHEAKKVHVLRILYSRRDWQSIL